MAKFRWNSRRLEEAVNRGANRGVFKAATRVHEVSVGQILRTKKTGTIYRRRSVLHQASAPGEAPASDTGALVQSGTVIRDPANLAARVNYSVSYAASLEFGTERMEPRPFLRPSLDFMRDQIPRIVSTEIRLELQNLRGRQL